jgi:hypothetical protein
MSMLHARVRHASAVFATIQTKQFYPQHSSVERAKSIIRQMNIFFSRAAHDERVVSLRPIAAKRMTPSSSLGANSPL